MLRKRIKQLQSGVKSITKNGFFHILFGSVLAKAISFISSIIIVRIVNKADYAYITYAYNLYGYINLLEGLGLTTALLRYCASDIDGRRDKAYLVFALKWGLIFEIALSLMLCVFISFVELPFAQARPIIYILAFLPGLNYVYALFQSYCRAHLKNKRYSTAGVVQAAAVCVLSIVLVLTVGTYGVLWARYLAILAGLCISASFVLKTTRGVEREVLTKAETRQFIGLGIGLMLSSLFTSAMPLNESMLISHIVKDEAATANYRIAGLIPDQLLLITGAVVIYYFPYIAKMKGGKAVYTRSIHISAINAAVVIAIAAVGIILNPFIIRLVYGAAYRDAEGISRLLWLARATNACLIMVPMNILAAIGKGKFLAISSSFICLLHFITCYIMITRFGSIGAIYASIVVYALSGALHWIYLKIACDKMKEGMI